MRLASWSAVSSITTTREVAASPPARCSAVAQEGARASTLAKDEPGPRQPNSSLTNKPSPRRQGFDERASGDPSPIPLLKIVGILLHVERLQTASFGIDEERI